MSMFTHPYRDLLQQKLELFQQMLELTEKQCQSITNEEELDELEKIIQLKQQIIEKVDAINVTLADMNQTSEREQNTQELTVLNQQMEEVARKIHQLDTTNIARWTTALEEVKNELDTVRNGKKVTQNYYTKPVQEGGYFINRRR